MHDRQTETANESNRPTATPVIDRRDYLKATGALTGVGLTAIGTATANDDSGDGDTTAPVIEPTDLRVDHEREPGNLAPDAGSHVFSWSVLGRRGTRQGAYRILVASNRETISNGTGDVWDSGKVSSSQSVDVTYAGDALEPDTTYYWSVRLWDGDGNASEWATPTRFTTAIPDTDDAWEGTWIGQEAETTLPGADWSDYAFAADFTIENDAVGFVFRADDLQNYYMWQVVLTSSPDNDTDTHLLRPHVWEDGDYTVLTDGPLAESGVPLDDVLGDAANSQHRFRVEMEGDRITTFIDGQQVDERTDGTHRNGTVGFRAFDRGATGDERALIDDVDATDSDGTTLFTDDFEHDSVEHFSGGTIQDGQLLLAGTNVVLRDDGGLDSEQWTDYTFETDFTVENAAAGLVFRAQDADNLYMWQVNTVRGPPPLLRPHVRSNGGWATLPPVELDDVMGEDPHGQHRIRIEVVGDQITTFVDDQQVHRVTDDTHAAGAIGFRQYGDEHAKYDNVSVTAPDGEVLFADDFEHEYVQHFSDGSIVDGQLDLEGTGVVLVAEPQLSSPLLRTETTIEKSIQSARAHVLTLGYGELYVNGERVGDEKLNPAWTVYGDRVLYSTHDVGDVLQGGENALGLWLGRGWFSKTVSNWDSYGAPRALLQVNVTYTDGTSDSIVTDADWRLGRSPIIENDIYDGETYDARLEASGWAQAGFDDGDWKRAKESAPPADDVKRRPQRMQPIQVNEELAPVDVWTHDGDYVVDFGQNHTGWLELSIRGANEGDQITLKHAEILTDGGDIDTANLRDADATDTYVATGADVETYEPRFTYHGYRYAKILGYPGELSADDVVSKVVHTGFDQTGTFACANEELNQVQQNAVWGLRSNAHSIPTDCCQRDERMGWTGDGHLAVNSHLLNFDATRFQWKWMYDHDDDQSAAGAHADTIPHAYGSRDADPNWAKTRVVNAWRIYQHTGDERVLKERYEGMKAYVDYWTGVAEEHVVPGSKNHYGDWLALEDRYNDLALMNTFSYFQSTERFARIAGVLGREEDAATYRDRAAAIEAAFNDEFFDPSTNTYGSGDQTSYALPLFEGLVPEDRADAVAANLADRIEADGGKLQTGFVGTRPLIFALVQHGYEDLAYQVVSQPEEPGWVHMVRLGATTMWERWDAEDHGPGLNSRNHSPWALVSEWFYRELAGIQPGEAGYEHVTIDPLVPSGLEWAEGDVETVRGSVSSAWERTNTRIDDDEVNRLRLDVTVPANATATVRIPALGVEKARVRESEKVIWNNGNRARPLHAGVKGVVRQGDEITVEIGSGTYQFELIELDA